MLAHDLVARRTQARGVGGQLDVGGQLPPLLIGVGAEDFGLEGLGLGGQAVETLALLFAELALAAGLGGLVERPSGSPPFRSAAG